jgi:hypothetical protein
MADVSITVDIPCKDKVLSGATVIGPCHVLGWYLHRTEFIEFIIFDVLAFWD